LHGILLYKNRDAKTSDAATGGLNGLPLRRHEDNVVLAS